jgi:anthranilate synthase component II
MKHKLLIVDNYDSFTYNLVQIVKEHTGWDVDVIKHDKIKLKSVQEYDKIIFSPGPGVPSDYSILKEIIDVYSANKSILGICLGHQAIVEAFGGKIYNLEKVYHGIKQKINILDLDDYLFKDLPNEIEAGLYHSWAASQDQMPSCLKITVVSSNNIIMAVSHNKYDVKGLQFHPESYMTKTGRQMLFNWLNYPGI